MAIHLRPFTEADFVTLIGWFTSEAALVQWGGADMRFPLDEAQLADMLREGRGDPPARWLFSGVVEGEIAGHCQAALDWRHGVARLGRVAVNPVCRGQGLAAPFLRQVIERVFADPAFERIELNVYTFNSAAIRTYRGLGFIEEGVRRSSVRVGQQRWDTAMYGLLRTDPR
jgi:RimJ/RimL family protein N-acetyltransferase